MPAALFMARLMGDLRYLTHRLQDPAAVLQATNRELARQARLGMFVTTVCLILESDQGLVRYASGGHLPLLLLRKEGKVEVRRGTGGPPLGILPDQAYPPEELRLGHGETVVLYTDGALEAKNRRGQRFGMDRLVAGLEAATREGGRPVAKLLEAIGAFAEGTPQHDDITLVQMTWC